MTWTKTVTLENFTHVITYEWDGFALDPAEQDGGKVLGLADLVPDEARRRRGTWKVTVEFESATADLPGRAIASSD